MRGVTREGAGARPIKRVLSVAVVSVIVLGLPGCAGSEAEAPPVVQTSSPSSRNVDEAVEESRRIIVEFPTPNGAVEFTAEDSSGTWSQTKRGSGRNIVFVVPQDVPTDVTFSVTSGDGETQTDSPDDEGEIRFWFDVAPAGPAAPVYTPSPDQQGSITWRMESSKGYSYDLRMVLDPATDGGTIGEHNIGVACDFDPARDVVIPGRLIATATTEGFPTSISASLIMQKQTNSEYSGQGVTPQQDDGRLSIEQYFMDGPKCTSGSSTGSWVGSGTFAVRWPDPVENGDSVQSRFAIIVKDVYTPNTPEGDPELLDWIEVRATVSGMSNEQTGPFTDPEGASFNVSTKGITLNGDIVGPRE